MTTEQEQPLGKDFVASLYRTVAAYNNNAPRKDMNDDELISAVVSELNKLKSKLDGKIDPKPRKIERWFLGANAFPKSQFDLLLRVLAEKVPDNSRAELIDEYKKFKVKLRNKRAGSPTTPPSREMKGFDPSVIAVKLADWAEENHELRQRWELLQLSVGVQRIGDRDSEGRSWYSPDGVRFILDLLRRHRKAAYLRVFVSSLLGHGTGKGHLSYGLRSALVASIRKLSHEAGFDSPYPFPLFVHWPAFFEQARAIDTQFDTARALAGIILSQVGLQSSKLDPLELLRSSTVVVILHGIELDPHQPVPPYVIDFLCSIRRLVLFESLKPKENNSLKATKVGLPLFSTDTPESPDSETGRYFYSLSPLPFDSRVAAEMCRDAFGRYVDHDGHPLAPTLGDNLRSITNAGILGRVLAAIRRGDIHPECLRDDSLLFAGLYMSDLRNRTDFFEEEAKLVLGLAFDQMHGRAIPKDRFGEVRRWIRKDLQAVELKESDPSILVDDAKRWLFRDELKSAMELLQAWFQSDVTSMLDKPNESSQTSSDAWPSLVDRIDGEAACELWKHAGSEAKELAGTDLEACISSMNARIKTPEKKTQGHIAWADVRREWKAYSTALRLFRATGYQTKQLSVQSCWEALRSVFEWERSSTTPTQAALRVNAASAASQLIPIGPSGKSSFNLVAEIDRWIEEYKKAPDADRENKVYESIFWAEVTRNKMVNADLGSTHSPTINADRDKLGSRFLTSLEDALKPRGNGSLTPLELHIAHARFHVVEVLTLVAQPHCLRRHLEVIYRELVTIREKGGTYPTAVEEAICLGTLVRLGVPIPGKTGVVARAWELAQRAKAQLYHDQWRRLVPKATKIPFGITSHLFVVLQHVSPLLPAFRRQSLVDNEVVKYLADENDAVRADEVDAIINDSSHLRWLLNWLKPEFLAGIIIANQEVLRMLKQVWFKLEATKDRSSIDEQNLQDLGYLLAVAGVSMKEDPA